MVKCCVFTGVQCSDISKAVLSRCQLISDGQKKTYHRKTRKMRYIFILTAFTLINPSTCKSINVTEVLTEPTDENFDNNIIDFDEDYSVKYNKKHSVPWQANDISKKDAYKYTVVKNHNLSRNDKTPKHIIEETTPSESLGVIPLELLSTTDTLLSIIDSTTEPDLTVIPLSTTKKVVPTVEITQTVTLPSSTQQPESSTDSFYITTEHEDKVSTVSEKTETTTTKREVNNKSTEIEALNKEIEEKGRVKLEFESTSTTTDAAITTEFKFETKNNADNLTTIKTHLKTKIDTVTDTELNTTIDTTTNTNIKSKNVNTSTTLNVANVNENKDVSKVENGTQNEVLKTNTSKIDTNLDWDIDSKEITPFSGLDSEEQEVPEDYYDSKDVLPTTAPKNDALSVIFGLAGSVVESVVESVAERVVPKGIYDLFKRMQRQSEALEAERLRSREENGGLGQFGRGILKTISTGLSKPLSQLMAGVKDIGSLDSDRGFVSSLASGVTSVASAATSLADSFKDRVQAIYPGTVWCGDGHSAQARSSSELGLFFFTDTCCRQHDACKIYIRAGDTKYGLTNTGLFTRSHCSCDAKFRECLRKTNSLVSAQIGLTYFNVLGPQCFRKAHPIVRCVRKTRITGQKCEEYELDYTKPKMWQWFDNETF